MVGLVLLTVVVAAVEGAGNGAGKGAGNGAGKGTGNGTDLEPAGGAKEGMNETARVAEAGRRWLDAAELQCRRNSALVTLAQKLLAFAPLVLNALISLALTGLLFKLRVVAASNNEVKEALKLLRKTAVRVAFPPGHALALRTHYGDLNKAIQTRLALAKPAS